MATDSDQTASAAASLRASTWSTPALLGGVGLIVLWRSMSYLDFEWVSSDPYSIFFIVTAILPLLFLLIYPLITRRQKPPARFCRPSLKRLAIEAAIAVPIILACAALLWGIELVLTKLSPGTSLVDPSYDRLTRSTPTLYVYVDLAAAVFYGPIAEELFYRGFLLNAFRARMPLVAAMVLQSVVFGFFGHYFTWAPALAATCFGLLLAVVYHWRQTIYTPIFVHAGYNALAAVGVLFAMHAHANGPSLGVLSKESGTSCEIGAIVPDSPADDAGLLPGDTITHIDGYPVQNFQSLQDTIAYYRAGDVVVVTILRKGETLETDATLVSRSSIPRP